MNPSERLTQHTQLGASLLDAIWALSLIVLLSIIVYGYAPADASHVRDVVQMASGDAAAQAALKEGLAEYPAPTNFELSRIRKEVNAAVVASEARALIPDSTTQGTPPSSSSPSTSSAEALPWPLETPYLRAFLGIALFVGLLAGGVQLSRRI